MNTLIIILYCIGGYICVGITTYIIYTIIDIQENDSTLKSVNAIIDTWARAAIGFIWPISLSVLLIGCIIGIIRYCGKKIRLMCSSLNGALYSTFKPTADGSVTEDSNTIGDPSETVVDYSALLKAHNESDIVINSEMSNAKPKSSSITVVVTCQLLQIRAAPTTNARPICQIPKGTILQVEPLPTNDEWYRVTLYKHYEPAFCSVGYIMSRYCSAVDDDTKAFIKSVPVSYMGVRCDKDVLVCTGSDGAVYYSRDNGNTWKESVNSYTNQGRYP